jgi:hypothetical protein
MSVPVVVVDVGVIGVSCPLEFADRPRGGPVWVSGGHADPDLAEHVRRHTLRRPRQRVCGRETAEQADRPERPERRGIREPALTFHCRKSAGSSRRRPSGQLRGDRRDRDRRRFEFCVGWARA